MEFKNKTILVTGASSGIGEAFCRQFAALGANLVMTARRGEAMNALAAELRSKHGTRIHIVTADLARETGAREVISFLHDEGLTVDVLINNAGFGHFGEFIDGEATMFRDMIGVNITSLVDLTRLLLPGMVSRGQGGILNVASMAGSGPVPNSAVYAATKAFVIRFSEALWYECRGTGVHVSVLCPGPVDTAFFDAAGGKPSKTLMRSVETADQVVKTGIEALRRNKRKRPTTLALRLVDKLSRITPVWLTLAVAGAVMRKSQAS
jgi:uncharacterized protein